MNENPPNENLRQDNDAMASDANAMEEETESDHIHCDNYLMINIIWLEEIPLVYEHRAPESSSALNEDHSQSKFSNLNDLIVTSTSDKEISVENVYGASDHREDDDSPNVFSELGTFANNVLTYLVWAEGTSSEHDSHKANEDSDSNESDFESENNDFDNNFVIHSAANPGALPEYGQVISENGDILEYTGDTAELRGYEDIFPLLPPYEPAQLPSYSSRPPSYHEHDPRGPI